MSTVLPKSPHSLYGQLFEDVQLSGLFKDSKTFADATAMTAPSNILQSYQAIANTSVFNQSAFVNQYFETHSDLPNTLEIPCSHASHVDADNAIQQLWKRLERPADRQSKCDSLLNLPYPYIVPGGRFKEIYYWDSYFTMLGLLEHGKVTCADNMLKNFAYLIDTYGVIPNGNRSYYLSRSQAPYFSLMVSLLAQSTGDDDYYQHYLPQLQKEHSFWMEGESNCQLSGRAEKHVININGFVLNRYWDQYNAPRDESYKEDHALLTETVCHPQLMRDIRSAAESGWDFSSRWCKDPHQLNSTQTTLYAPIDLNCLLAYLEQTIAHALKLAKRPAEAQQYEVRSSQRIEAIRTLFYDEALGFFTDITTQGEAKTAIYGATIYPLFFGYATKQQASTTAHAIEQTLLQQGGWLTSTIYSGQQWDAPNGWAPLQWLNYIGLRNYGFKQHADKGAMAWVNNVLAVFQATGLFLEKYNVTQIGLLATGGEYEVQDGFGWTNGVYAKLSRELNLV